MEIEILEATDEPDALMCRAARNDYGADPTANLEEVLETVDEGTVPEYALESYSQYPIDRAKEMFTLISHLFDHGHFGVAEHPSITFSVKGVSRSLMAQLTRHRHVSFDIQSMRYCSFDEADPSPGEAVVQIPELDDPGICGRNGEFSEEWNDVGPDEIISERNEVYEDAMETAFDSYVELLNLGVAPENARMVLPIGTKINMVFTLNARMLMHVGDMRAAGDAQWEVREMTEEILEKAREWCPIGMGYYMEELHNRKNRLAP